MQQINEKIKLSREEILSQYFVTYQPHWNREVIPIRYQQINMDKSIAEIDAS